MTGRLIAILCCTLLASCGGLGDSLGRLNPLNLIGGQEETSEGEAEQEQAFAVPRKDDGKSDISSVTLARLDYTPSGVIVRANGEAPTQGYHSTSLRPLNFGQPDGNGAIWYEFRAMAPKSTQPIGTVANRTLSVGHFIPNSRLRAVRSVTITAAQNDVTIRLR